MINHHPQSHIPSSNLPKHVAIIMDGNGRWAQQKGLPRFKGHEEGINRVEDTVRLAHASGVRYLTLYAFSKENWKRPAEEVSFLMSLLVQFLDSKLKMIMENNIVFRLIGELTDLPSVVQKKLEYWIDKTSTNTGMNLNIALSYSARFEIIRACQKIAEKVAAGNLKPSEITEDLFSASLYTGGLPDPDLLIRTSGETRISNFLLWQLSYAELFFTPVLWPDFREAQWKEALEEYARRERRFGLTEPKSEVHT